MAGWSLRLRASRRGIAACDPAVVRRRARQGAAWDAGSRAIARIADGARRRIRARVAVRTSMPARMRLMEDAEYFVAEVFRAWVSVIQQLERISRHALAVHAELDAITDHVVVTIERGQARRPR